MDRVFAFARGYERGYHFGHERGFARGQQELCRLTPSYYEVEDCVTGLYPDPGDIESKDLNETFYRAFEEGYKMGFGRGLERGSKHSA